MSELVDELVLCTQSGLLRWYQPDLVSVGISAMAMTYDGRIYLHKKRSEVWEITYDGRRKKHSKVWEKPVFDEDQARLEIISPRLAVPISISISDEDYARLKDSIEIGDDSPLDAEVASLISTLGSGRTLLEMRNRTMNEREPS